MKKTLFLLPILAVASLSAIGCKSKLKARITYGTLVDTDVTEIKYGALAKKVSDASENFLISVYDDSEKGQSCGCWKTSFKPVLQEYVKRYHTRIYIIARSQFGSDDDTFGLTILDSSSTDPTFALFKKGQKANQYIYNAKEPMFSNIDSFREAVMNIASDPQFYYVDHAYLEKALFTAPEDKVVVQYIWSFCPDCNDCFPNVLIPYAEKNELKTKLYLIDLAIPGILLNEEGEFEGTGLQSYVDFLNEYHLSASGDEVFGYDRGFVPSMQVWEKGELKDMNVYFNDAVSKSDQGQYYVSRSYYSEDRIAFLAHANQIVEGRILDAEEVDDNESGMSWKKDYARKVHQPILEAFLDRYTK